MLHVGTNNPNNKYEMNNNIDNTVIPIVRSENEKDLGVTFDGSLKFDIHI